MTRLRADWVVPVDQPPIAGGWLDIADGRIVALGGPDTAGPGAARDLGRVALMPGLVNAHTHLELSWLRDRVPPANQFTSWIKQLFAARGTSVERPDDPRVIEAAREAVREARDCGTAAIGDISNSLASVDVLEASGLDGIVFHELLGFRETADGPIAHTAGARQAAAARGGRVRVSMAPHAPYSVSPELFRAIRAAVSASDVPWTSIHVAESPEEMELLASGTGEWAKLLRWIGAWRDDWQVPGTGPVEYLDALGVLDQRTLVVHGVQLEDAALRVLRDRGCTLVTCPRSNQWVGVGVPPLARFYRSGVPVAIGTDSLASVADLNLFAELQAMHWMAPEIPPATLIESATLTGARALGLDTDLGSLTPGKRAAVLAVALPDEATDVERFLVSGVSPKLMTWPSVTG
ncbi:MAG: amidohydrolase family protein [Vicinamibacterales bacterium]